MLVDLISQKHRELAEHYVFVMKEIAGIDIYENTRKRAYVVARAIISHCLEAEGCPVSDAGRLLGVNHSTVIYYRDRFELIFAPGGEAEKELWEKFNASIYHSQDSQAHI